MEYGILIAIGEDGDFQIIGSVASINEARELIQNYVSIGPELGFVPPFEFQIHRRRANGAYALIEKVSERRKFGCCLTHESTFTGGE